MLNAGDVLQGRYRVISQLGKGGMGAVYHAWDMRLSIPVALKEMLAQPDLDSETLQDFRAQFQQEAVVLARLTHPHLVGVTDFFQEGRNVYLVMKYVEGESLASVIRQQGAIPEAQVLVWAAQLLDALAYCHQEGVIHRDIKPQNIIIRPDGDAVLVDFGLVKLWDPNDPKTRTAVRGVGTPQYAPPEQYELSAGHTEPRSDIYSLGATFYHALTGEAPPSATMRIAAPEDFQPVHDVAAGVSSRTAKAIEQAMELARSSRWGSAGAMAQALGLEIRDWVAPPVAAAATDGRGGTVRMDVASTDHMTRRRFPTWLLVVLGLTLVLVGGGAAMALTGVLPIAALPFGTAPTATGTMTPTVAPPSPTATEAAPAEAATPKSTPTPILTLTPSETPRPKDAPVDAPTDAPTETAQPDATATTDASPTPSPTVTPTSATSSSTATPTTGPTATSSAQAGPTGALVDFEQWGSWRRGDEPYGELTQTQAQVKGGAYAAQLVYNFPAVEKDYVVFMQSRSIAGQPNTFAAWVYGDGSGHFLNLWIIDAKDEIWSVHLGKVGGTGWRQMTGNLAPGLPWPAGHVTGPDDGVIDYPVRFYALVLDRPASGPQQGTIYIDEITAWSGNVAAATPQPTLPAAQATATSVPTAPSGDVGSILFTVQTGDGFYLYSTDPGWSQMVEVGRTDGGFWTCDGTSASTLVGDTFNFYSPAPCNLTERMDACTSPDGNYKLITNFNGESREYAVLLQDVAAGSDTFIYQGKLNAAAGVQWSSTSRHVAFAVGTSLQVVPVSTGAMYQAISLYDDRDGARPRFSPDGRSLFYLKPVGGAGNADVFIVSVDGTGERNLTNAPAARKLCPRWRR